MRNAIIDLGSNSVRMSIWDDRKRIYNSRLFVRLSEGLASDNLLKEEPCNRTISALSEFSKKIAELSPDNLRVVATEALRRADNSKEFIARVKNETGLEIEILSGDDESYYDYLSAKDLISNKNAFLLDVGGGSLELIKVKNGSLESHICLPLGAVVMTDLCSDDAKLLEEKIRYEFQKLSFFDGESYDIIGLGGSVRTFFTHVKANAHGEILEKDEFYSFAEDIFSKDREYLKKIPAFHERFDVIKAGIIPFYVLFDMANSEKIILSNKGVREGILEECLSR